jgi:hypothetical protein
MFSGDLTFVRPRRASMLKSQNAISIPLRNMSHIKLEEHLVEDCRQSEDRYPRERLSKQLLYQRDDLTRSQEAVLHTLYSQIQDDPLSPVSN